MITFFIAFILAGPVHDIKMAIFEIFETDSGLAMTVSVDREDFYETLTREFPEKVKTHKIEDLAFLYLDSKTKITVNGACTSFAIHEIEFGELNIHLTGSLNLRVDGVKEIRVTNTCMIEHYEGHDNIIKLKLNDRTRSFRLNSKRTSTVATY
ncbi:DUF6702 family protein [Ekhidna sp.]|uniref:DUF6702 family protein n=1 Tax=Ekhidna sp. TaxID=2608089 RepID=UPI0035128DD6